MQSHRHGSTTSVYTDVEPQRDMQVISRRFSLFPLNRRRRQQVLFYRDSRKDSLKQGRKIGFLSFRVGMRTLLNPPVSVPARE